MSYSFTTAETDIDGLDDAVADCIASVPPSGGAHEEALAHQPVASTALAALADAYGFDRFTASVSGHGYDGYTSLNLAVTRQSSAETEPAAG